MKYFIQTFGCQANLADSERLAAFLEEQGMVTAKEITEADYIVINTCMIRQSAEDRVYGLVRNLAKLKAQKPLKIVLTGCLVGMALKDQSGGLMVKIKKRLPQVDEFLPIEEIGFDHFPLRTSKTHAWVLISNGCNNFCTYCVVPYSRGREISRPFSEILKECRNLKEQGYSSLTLVGQNVNSYGADIIKGNKNCFKIGQRIIKPVLVKHLGKYRIPTLFPYLLEEVAKLGFQKVDFISSNPWDFSDELIEVIAQYKNISRLIHLPVQSGDDEILKKMNRWYTAAEYLNLVQKLRKKIPEVQLSTDIIVGFCGETEAQFQNTVKFCQQVGFVKAYISLYSDRPLTVAHKIYSDNVPYQEKKRRWQILEDLINKPNLSKLKNLKRPNEK